MEEDAEGDDMAIMVDIVMDTMNLGIMDMIMDTIILMIMDV